MKIKRTITLLILALSLTTVLNAAEADSAPSKEYQVKAAFIFNFIKFVDWLSPAGAEADQQAEDNTKPITIGIIGKSPFGNAFDAITKKKIQGREVVIKTFPEFAKNSTKNETGAESKYKYKYKHADALKGCQVLFVCISERDYYREIIETVKDGCVLTIGETKEFLETGGVIEFTTEKKKVKFAINLISAEEARLKIRSKLLRLAKRVVQKEGENT